MRGPSSRARGSSDPAACFLWLRGHWSPHRYRPRDANWRVATGDRWRHSSRLCLTHLGVQYRPLTPRGEVQYRPLAPRGEIQYRPFMPWGPGLATAAPLPSPPLTSRPSPPAVRKPPPTCASEPCAPGRRLSWFQWFRLNKCELNQVEPSPTKLNAETVRKSLT